MRYKPGRNEEKGTEGRRGAEEQKKKEKTRRKKRHRDRRKGREKEKKLPAMVTTHSHASQEYRSCPLSTVLPRPGQNSSHGFLRVDNLFWHFLHGHVGLFLSTHTQTNKGMI